MLMWPCLCNVIPSSLKARYHNWCINRSAKRKKRVFTRKNRFISRMKSNYGFWGVIIATPVILTIPIGAFLANKYYSQRRHTVFIYDIINNWLGRSIVGIRTFISKVFF